MSKSSTLHLVASSVHGWDKRPRSLHALHGKEIGPYGIAVYSALLYTARGNPTTITSHATIAGLTGMSKRQVRYTLDNLQAVHLLRRIHRHNYGEQLMNEYELLAR